MTDSSRGVVNDCLDRIWPVVLGQNLAGCTPISCFGAVQTDKMGMYKISKCKSEVELDSSANATWAYNHMKQWIDTAYTVN